MKRLLDRFRRRVKVEITCPCGPFIPGTYRPGRSAGRYACKRCGYMVRISTHRGPADW